MSVFSTIIGKARPQIPLEALISSRRTGLYKTCYRGYVKSGMPYVSCKLADNTDDDTQAFIGTLSLDEEIEIVRNEDAGKYSVCCGGIEFGCLNPELISGIEHPDECETFIHNIELSTGGMYEVMIGIIR